MVKKVNVRNEFISVPIKDLECASDLVRAAAIRYRKLTNRDLNITGELGEILVCTNRKIKTKKLKLVASQISPGYDAVDKNGKTYQIKSRLGQPGPGTKLSKFSKHHFDFAILLILRKSDYRIEELWEASWSDLSPVLNTFRDNKIRIGEFKRVARKL